MDPSDIPSQQFWQDLGRALYADAIRSFARYGVQVAPNLALIFDDSLYSYYDRPGCVVSLPAPNAETLGGRLMWCYYQRITGAENLEELARFMRLGLARFVAHELAHHLRHHYRTETENAWLEEQVANAVGTAYARSRKDLTRDELEFLTAFLQRAKDRLQELAPTDAVTASYSELERVLVDQGLLVEAELEEARAFAVVTRGELRQAVLAAQVVPFETVDASLQSQRAAQEYFNANYMVNLVEYLRFQLAWFLADLQRPPVDLGEALQDYIVTGDAGRRHRRESLAFLTTQLFAAPPAAAELAASALAQDAPDEAEPILRAALAQREPEGAGAALAALATILEPAAIDSLCEKSAGGPPGLAVRAAEVWYSCLGKEGPALNLLRSLLHGAEALPALEVVSRLRLSVLAPDVVRLLTGLSDAAGRDATVEAAWRALASFAPTPSVPVGLIRRGARSEDSSVRGFAVRLASPGALSRGQWTQLLDDPSPAVREAARERLEAPASQRLYPYLHRRSRLALGEARALMRLQIYLPPGQEVWSRLLAALARERGLTALRLGRVGASLPSGIEGAVVSRDPAARRFAMKVMGPRLPELTAFWEDEGGPGLGAGSMPDRRAAVRSLARSGSPVLRAALATLSRQAGIDWLEPVAAGRRRQQAGPDATASAKRQFAPTEEIMALSAVEKIVFLKTVPLFADVPTEELMAVAGSLVPEHYQSGEQVCAQHQPGDALYIVMEGHLVAQHQDLGQPPVTVNEFGPGECFGEMAVLDGEPRSATVVCTEDSRLLRLSGDRFRELGRDHPEMLFGVLASLSRRLRSTTRLAAERG